MIQLFSHDSSEVTTEIVMDWLNFLGAEHQRTNGIELAGDLQFNIQVDNQNCMSLSSSSDIENAQILWFRRWMEKVRLRNIDLKESPFFYNDVHNFVNSEFDGLTNSFFYLLKNQNWDNTPVYIQSYPIKLKQLDIAQKLGLKIPSTILTNNRKNLEAFLQKNELTDLIIKPIKDGTLIGSEEGFFCTYTSKIDMDNVPDQFFPSLFQEMIPKKIELRVFYYNKKCYAMAIFSSLDKQTEVDFRRYNYDKPNRNVPYSLPEHLVTKIISLMEHLSLNTGSLDLILDTNNEYIFLEVNPVGQFGMVSFPCNYYLERIVAQNLIDQSYVR